MKENFIYLSEILKVPLLDRKTLKKIASIIDISAILKGSYPKVTGILACDKKGHRKYIPWSRVAKFKMKGKKAIIINNLSENEENSRPENEILLKETFFDNQIVNTHGSRVVRVNDVQFLIEDKNLWVVHIDVGFKGFLRRLGYLRFINFIFRWLFSYNLKDKFIPWKYVQPLVATNVNGSNYLKISFSKLSELHPADLADIAADLGEEERLILFYSLDSFSAAKTLQELPMAIRVKIAENIDQKRFVTIIQDMQLDEVADLFDHMSHDKVEKYFTLLPMDKVVEIEELMAQSGFSAGSIMNSEYISVRDTGTAGDVIKSIKKDHRKTESIYYVYVVDKNDIPAGVLTLRDLLLAKASDPVTKVMRENVVKVMVHDNLKSVAEVFFKYDFNIVPVVDEAGRLKGIITIKDALESVFPEIREEAEGR